jgi:hypothetical protein
MKRLIIPFLLLISFLSNAQNFHIGPMAGVNFSNFETKIDSANFSSSSSYGGTGFHAGVFARIGLKKFYVQPELIYNVNKATDEQSYFGTTLKTTVTKSDLDINVLGGYNLLDLKVVKLRVNAGIKNSILLSGEGKAEISGGFASLFGATTTTDDDIFNNNAFGYTVGIGADITKITLDIRYNAALGDIDNDNSSTTNLSYISISVGFKVL